jgi:Adaptin N terminal region
LYAENTDILFILQVIASMTVGKDVSALFPDVVNCMQTDNLELKKLVYLYLMNYAKSQPDMAIMAVNTFVKVHESNMIEKECFLNKYFTGLRRSKPSYQGVGSAHHGLHQS